MDSESSEPASLPSVVDSPISSEARVGLGGNFPPLLAVWAGGVKPEFWDALDGWMEVLVADSVC